MAFAVVSFCHQAIYFFCWNPLILKVLMTNRPLRYADAGVDVDSWNATRGRLGSLVRQTYTPNVLGSFGQFGGLFSISDMKSWNKPVLVSSMDGVGTKLKIAVDMGIHDTVGQDLVNHCINDILVLGAQPLFFLDYIGTGKLHPEVAEKVIEGLSKACKSAGCVLIGGETAEMPGVYGSGDYDLVGTIVGAVDESQIIDGSTIRPGDIVIGLRSNGLHTNGYSLARKIVTEAAGKSYRDTFEPTGRSFGLELLRTHRSYLSILPLIRNGSVKGCAHITGGGFPDNVDRILPSTCDVLIRAGSWEPDSIFSFLQKAGNVEDREMYRTFNMGIGMVIVTARDTAKSILEAPETREFDPLLIGEIVQGSGKVTVEF
jgi:phosphoribosylformylglycinamidine cyclo-ligase